MKLGCEAGELSLGVHEARDKELMHGLHVAHANARPCPCPPLHKDSQGTGRGGKGPGMMLQTQ